MLQTLYTNGTILTLDGNNTIAEAMVVSGNSITYVGTLDQAQIHAGKSVEVIDLQGATLLPGFIEAHAHFSEYAVSLFLEVNCGEFDSIAEVKAALSAKANQLNPGEWVRGTNFDDSKIRDARHLTRHDLDQACPDNPVFVMHITCHAGYMNTEGLKRSQAWKNPELERTPDGNPVGILQRMKQVEPVLKNIPPYSVNQVAYALRKTIPLLHATGITTTFDGGIGFLKNVNETFSAYKQLDDSNELTVRTNLVFMQEYYDNVHNGICAGWESSDMLYHGAVKFFQDGSIQAYSAALSDDYLGKPGHKSSINWEQESFNKAIASYHKRGIQIAIHANGDEAIEAVLVAIEKAQKIYPRPDPRHMVIHCQLATQQQLARMKAIGIVPSFFVSHIFYWGERHLKLFLGKKRAATINPVNSALAFDLKPSIHTDAPVTPMQPLMCIHAAVNRVTREGTLLGPQERISVLDALRCCTLNAAWAEFQEDQKGTLEVGKLADFVILAENPITVSPNKLKDIQVKATIVAGKRVYTRSLSELDSY